MKFSGKVCLKIIFKITKNQGFTFTLEDTFSKNHRKVSNWPNPPPSPSFTPAVLGLNGHYIFFKRKFFIYFSGFSFYKISLGFYNKSNCLLICNFSFSSGAAQHLMVNFSKLKSHKFMCCFCDILLVR